MPHTLTEHLRDWSAHGVAVDRAARLIRNVALTGTESKNGYRYSEEALRDAVSLYENKPVFLDHAPNARRPFERSTRDLVGSIVAPRYAAGRIRGDIRTVDTEAGRTFLALAETSGPAVGMSHVVLAEKNSDGTIVERIVEVVSVDAVAFPATTSTLHEQTDGDANARDARLPNSILPGSCESLLDRLDDVLSEHFDQHADHAASDVRRAGLFSHRMIVEARTADTDAPQLFAVPWHRGARGEIVLGEKYEPFELAMLADEVGFDEESLGERKAAETEPADELSKLRRERDALAARLARHDESRRKARRWREVERLIEASRLPPYAVTDLFREQLLAAPDAGTRRRLLEERRTLIDRTTRPAPHSRERPAESHPGNETEAALVAAIRRR